MKNRFILFIKYQFLVQVKIRSRFTFTTIHNTWIQYSKNPDKHISYWYYTCPAGARVLGTCSHTVSVLWYLGYAQHDHTALTKKSSMNLIKFCQNYALNEFPNDESEDESEIENDETIQIAENEKNIYLH